MKLSVFYDHILQAHEQTGRPVPELLQFCRSLGIDAVEMEYRRFAGGETAIRAMLQEAGLAVSCFYQFFDFPGNADLSEAKKLLETASDLGTAQVLFVPGELNSQEAAELSACSKTYADTARFMENSQSVRRMQRALADLTAYASRLGVKITLEDFDGFTQPFARMNQLLWFMRNVPGLCYTLDMGNFAFSDEDAVAAARLLKEYIVHVHCKDRALNPSVCGTFCKGLGQTPAGSGYLPLKELIGMLKEWGYDGYLAIEHFDVPDQAACIEQSAAFLRGFSSGCF